MRICHLADIHLRLKDRHEEYNEVFKTLSESLKKDAPDRIVVAGDIAHSKINLSPELVIEIRNFLSMLASIAPVDLIPGNHDLNMRNLERLDALTPCIPADSKHPITYFKKTGIHEIPETNIVYGVWSCIDGLPLLFSEKDKNPDKTYIALFHGPIAGCVLDNGYSLQNISTSLRLFDAFDIGMFGDIHCFQTFRKDKSIAYCGSLIQQDYGESLDKGYLLWDTDSKTFERRFIPNRYGFYTIEAENEKLPDVNLPEKCRVRIVWHAKYSEMSKSKIAELTNRIHEKYRPLSVQFTFKPIEDEEKGVIIQTGKDIRELSVQQNLLSQWLDLKEITDKEEILALDRKIYEQIDPKVYEDFSNSTWRIRKISIDNFLSYGGKQIIDFENMVGVVGIFGDNAAGKSTIIDAILYALFNKITRKVKNEDLVNKRTTSDVCSVVLELEINGVDYYIERSTTRLFKKKLKEFSGSKTDLIIKRKFKNDDEWEDLSEEQRNASEKVIRNAIGTYDDFLTVTLATQGSNTEFINQGPADRSDNMLRFLGLNMLQGKHKLANDLLKETLTEIKQYDLQRETATLAESKEKLISSKADCEVLSLEVAKFDEKIDELNSLYTQFSSTLNKEIEVSHSKEDLEKEIQKFSSQKADTLREINVVSKNLKELDSVSAKIDEEFSLTVEELEKLNKIKIEVLELTKKRDKLQTDIDSSKRVLFVYKNQIESATECPVSYDKNHKTCSFLLGHFERLEEHEKLIFDIETKTKDLEILNGEIDQKSTVLSIISEHENISELVKNAAIKKKELDSRLKSAKEKIEFFDVSIKFSKNKLEEIERNKETIAKNAEIQENLRKINNKKLEIQVFKKEKSAKLLQAERTLAAINQTILTIEQKLEKIKELEKTRFVLSTYCSAMHRDGIPATILKENLDQINYIINLILSDVVSFGVYFVMEDDSTDVKIVMKHDGEIDDTRPAQMASGMERFFINFAIRYALISVSTLNKPSMLIIDEGFGVIRSEHLDLVMKFFGNIRETFRNIIMITHIDLLKDIADHVINVEMKNRISTLTCDSP